MAGMNVVVLSGNLARDVDYAENQQEPKRSHARFTVAVGRKQKNENGTYDADFINCVAFGRTAEFINKWFHKGSPVIISGRLTTGSYTNKDGVKVYTTTVTVNDVSFSGNKNGDAGGQIPQPTATPQPTITMQEAAGGLQNIPGEIDEELPFS